MSETVATTRAWHGPASVAGVMAGLLLEALPILAGPDKLWVLFFLPPVVGLVLLVAGGTLRQVGVGLLAAGLAYPIALATYLLVALTG
jgi:hypothetical protein